MRGKYILYPILFFIFGACSAENDKNSEYLKIEKIENNSLKVYIQTQIDWNQNSSIISKFSLLHGLKQCNQKLFVFDLEFEQENQEIINFSYEIPLDINTTRRLTNSQKTIARGQLVEMQQQLIDWVDHEEIFLYKDSQTASCDYNIIKDKNKIINGLCDDIHFLDNKTVCLWVSENESKNPKKDISEIEKEYIKEVTVGDVQNKSNVDFVKKQLEICKNSKYKSMLNDMSSECNEKYYCDVKSFMSTIKATEEDFYSMVKELNSDVIYFGSANSRLDSTDETTIKKFVEDGENRGKNLAREGSRLETVYFLFGRSDSDGSITGNQNLAAQRNFVVKKKMLEFGIKEENIKAISFGEQALQIKLGDKKKEKQENRTVTMIMVYCPDLDK